MHTIVSDYRTQSRNGQELESTSLLLRDGNGDAYAALCVNADLNKLRQAQALLNEMLAEPEDAAAKDTAAAPPSIDVLVQEIIEDGIGATGKPVSTMTKEDKLEAVDHMSKRGLFLIRASAGRQTRKTITLNQVEPVDFGKSLGERANCWRARHH